MVGAELGRPVAVDADPKHVVALGAAQVAARSRVPVAVAAPTAPVPTVLPDPTPSEPVAAQPVTKKRAPAPPPPSSGNGMPLETSPGGVAGKRPRKGLLVAGAAVVVVLAVAAGALMLGGGGGGGGGEENAAGDGFISACPGAGDPAVCITDVGFEGDELAVEFTDHDVELGGDLVPVFFLTEITEDEAGSVTDRTSDWQAWGPSSPFQGENEDGQQGFTSDDIGGSRTAVCVLIGDTQGRVAEGTGNCAALP